MKRKKPTANNGQLDLLAHRHSTGNPYAHLSPDSGDEPTPTGNVHAWGTPPATKPSPAQQSLPRIAPYVRHPYAFASMEQEPETEQPATEAAPRKPPAFATVRARAGAATKGLSKPDYRRECGRILNQYAPESLGRLPQHFRDFIDRNERRSAQRRQAIVLALKKYDLADLGRARGQFNREAGTMTDEKLQEIERIADDSE